VHTTFQLVTCKINATIHIRIRQILKVSIHIRRIRILTSFITSLFNTGMICEASVTGTRALIVANIPQLMYFDYHYNSSVTDCVTCRNRCTFQMLQKVSAKVSLNGYVMHSSFYVISEHFVAFKYCCRSLQVTDGYQWQSELLNSCESFLHICHVNCQMRAVQSEF